MSSNSVEMDPVSGCLEPERWDRVGSPQSVRILQAGQWHDLELRHICDRGLLTLFERPLQAEFRPGEHLLLSGDFGPRHEEEQVWCQVRTVTPICRRYDGRDVGILGLTFVESDPITHRLRSALGQQHPSTLIMRLGSAEPLFNGVNDHVIQVTSYEEALHRLEQTEIATIVVLADGDVTLTQSQWTALRWTYPAQFSNVVVISQQAPEVSSSTLLYRCSQRLEANQLSAILGAAHADYRRSMAGRLDGGLKFMLQSENLAKVQAIATRLAIQRDLTEATRFVAQSIQTLTHASAAACLMISRFDGSVIGTSHSGEAPSQEIRQGLTGYVLGTGRSMNVDRLASTKCFEPSTDMTLAGPNDRVIVGPIHADSMTIGLMAISRSRNDPPFGEQEEQITRLACDLFASSLLALNLRESFAKACQQNLKHQVGLYREEALDHQAKAVLAEGDVLPFSPFWERWAFGTVALLLLAGILYAALGRIGEYAQGPAIIQSDLATRVTAHRSGVVEAVLALAGQKVEQGEVLFRIASQDQTDRLRNLDQGWRTQLIQRLLDPSDPGPQQALTQIRIERTALLQALEQNAVRAPHEGIVGELRIHAGELLQTGQTALTLTRDRPTYSLVALIPGRFAPQLSRGHRLRFKLRGYPDQTMDLVVDRISQGVVSPSDARRVIGPEGEGLVPMEGPVVLVYARLDKPTVEVDGSSMELLDGMVGDAELKLRSQTILTSMVPALKRVLGDRHEN